MNGYGKETEREFAEIARIDRHISGHYKFGTAADIEVEWYR